MKKLLSVVLAMMMMLSVVACGKKADTVSATLTNMNKFEANELNMEFQLKSEEDNMDMSIKLEAMNVDNKNMYINILAKGNVEDYSIEEYTKLTDVYIENGENFYVNAVSILDFAAEVDAQFAMVAGFLDFPEDYFKITKAEILEYCKASDVEILEEDFDAMFNAKADVKQNEKVLKIVGDFFDQYLKEGKDEVGSVKDGVVTITMNEKNAKKCLETLSKLDVEAFAKELFTELKNLDSSVEVDELLAEIEGANDQMKQAVENFDDSAFEDMDISFEFGNKDKQNFMNMKMNVEGVMMDFKMSATNAKVKKLEFPTASFGMDELENLINSLS